MDPPDLKNKIALASDTLSAANETKAVQNKPGPRNLQARATVSDPARAYLASQNHDSAKDIVKKPVLEQRPTKCPGLENSRGLNGALKRPSDAKHRLRSHQNEAEVPSKAR